MARRLGTRKAAAATTQFDNAYNRASTSSVSVRFPNDLLGRVASYGNTNHLNASDAIRSLVGIALDSLEEDNDQDN